jgi:hypothetical protein
VARKEGVSEGKSHGEEGRKEGKKERRDYMKEGGKATMQGSKKGRTSKVGGRILLMLYGCLAYLHPTSPSSSLWVDCSDIEGEGKKGEGGERESNRVWVAAKWTTCPCIRLK